MSVIVTRWESLGNGRVAIYAKTSRHRDVNITVGYHLLGSDVARQMLEMRAATVDAQAAVTAPPKGTEHTE